MIGETYQVLQEDDGLGKVEFAQAVAPGGEEGRAHAEVEQGHHLRRLAKVAVPQAAQTNHNITS